MLEEHYSRRAGYECVEHCGSARARSNAAGEERRFFMGLFNIFRKKQPDNRKYPAQSEQKSAVVEDKTKPEYWLNELRTRYLSENSTGRERINEALLTFGDSVYPQVRNYLFSLAFQYGALTGSISEINHRTEQGRMISGMVDNYSSALSNGVWLLSKFHAPNRAADICEFYKFINSKIYSHPEGGFSDMFNAIDIRIAAVQAMKNASGNHKETAEFYEIVLKDKCRFVRYEAIKNLREQWTPHEAQENNIIRGVLNQEYNAPRSEDIAANYAINACRKNCAYLLGKDV